MQNKRKKIFFLNLKELIIENIINNFKEYLIITILFIFGIIAGVFFVNNLSENQSSEITTYVNGFLDTFKQNLELNYSELFRDSVINNIILVVFLWFIGATLIGIPIVLCIVAFKGFCFGYTVSALIYILGVSKGMLFVFMTMFLQNIIFIPCIIALAVSGFRLYKTVIKNKNSENIKFSILKHTIFSLIILLCLILGSFIEVFVSTNLLKLCINFM